jgi:hypothetical protein
MRRHRLPTPTGRRVATQSQNVQPTLGSTARTICKATPLRSISYRHRTLLAPQAVVPTTTRHGHRNHPLPRYTRPFLPRTARLARGCRTTRVERSGLSVVTSAWLHTRRGAIGRTLRTTSLTSADQRPPADNPPGRPRRARYELREPDAHAPWTTTMTAQLRNVLGTDYIVTTSLNLLCSSLAPTTYANYDSGMRQLAAFATRKAFTPYMQPRKRSSATLHHDSDYREQPLQPHCSCTTQR